MISRHGGGRPSRRPPLVLVVASGATLMIALALAALCVGEPLLSPVRALELLIAPDGSPTAIIVQTLRMPRVVLAIAVGAALGVAGLVMQILTRNPLADPGILGVNSGAAFAVAVAVVVVGAKGFEATLPWAFAGAALAAVVVAALGGIGRSTSVARLALAGVAVGAVLAGFTQALSLLDPADYVSIRTWEAGSLAARDLPIALTTLLIAVIGTALALAVASGLDMLALGEDVAQTVGVRVAWIRMLGFVIVVVLCGSATAAIGPVAFVGLLVPHAVRMVVGVDTRRGLLVSAVAGPVLLLSADLLARIVIAPRELPLGVVTAFLGAPVLIALVRRKVRA